MRSEYTTAEAGQHTEIFRLMADAMQEHLHPELDAEKVREIVDEQIGRATLPRPVEVRLPDGAANKLEGQTHRQFDELLGLVNEGHRNIMLVGPAGSGKTTLAKSLAQALGLDFGFISLSAGVTETHLFGRFLPQADGSWQYQPSRFVQVYENGGVFLLDELDAADANLMVAINAALANGVLANPNGQIHVRHERCYILAAANTWGRGGDSQYVGRNQLDAATLDRFVLATVHVDYDAELERTIASGGLDAEASSALLQWIEDLRKAITSKRLRRIASTRLIGNAVMALRQGVTLDAVKSRYFREWSVDEKVQVCGG